ncbi:MULTISPECIES: hypothetical protein [unclassified Pseudoalteromonas]|uniref:hypothetical protein n=1 Tax=unclassified Pseudoalteromonas TaxID=194690 RepID=UPI0020980BD5|nr:hypothetical protein [Pseudoalteromonas sp. XMcav2-N]MCO7191005.1 hypothetical protein [Pseudoalteromonas sp. XMcav2-N]
MWISKLNMGIALLLFSSLGWTASVEISPAIASALAHTERPEKDKIRDHGAKTAEVLSFFKVEPGMAVMDIMSSGGYTTEALSWVVGEKGTVISHNDNMSSNNTEDEYASRFGNYDRLLNVSPVYGYLNDLEMGKVPLDRIVMINVFHNMFLGEYSAFAELYGKTDVPRVLKKFHSSLKPGGLLGVVDYHTFEQDTLSSTYILQRLPKRLAIEYIEQAGFELVGTLTSLESTKDDMSKPIYKIEEQHLNRYGLLFKKSSRDAQGHAGSPK